MADPISVALDVAARLDELKVAYLVAGSLASSVHGEPRATMDVDMLAALTPRSARRLARSLAGTYYVDADTASEAAARGGSFNAVHIPSAIKVDFFVAGKDEFEAERLRCRELVSLGEAGLYVDTAEHTLLRKLEWYRRGGEVSERQWGDVQAIARIQGDRLDRTRLSRWARHLGVSDLLDTILAG